MTLKETFESVGVLCDDKARRVSNVSCLKASITADEIEAGVTIERLATIGVPVFRYQTQVTIHGLLPDFSPEARPGGYCSLFRNSNGTIGVRYVAVDGSKKELVRRASFYGNQGWRANISSEGLVVGKIFETKEACVDAFRGFPRDLFSGFVNAGVCQSGRFYVLAHVGAIPERSLWSFIQRISGIESLMQLETLEEAAKQEAEKRRMEQIAANLAYREKVDSERREACQSFPNKPLSSIPTKGHFVRFARSTATQKVIPFLYRVERRGPALCYITTPYLGSPVLEVQGRKFSKVPDSTLKKWKEECAEKLIFEP